jgi:hypothetical protein
LDCTWRRRLLPETEACVQQPGTVRGADGSRLKQKPVSLRLSGITSLRTRCCGRERERETYTQRVVSSDCTWRRRLLPETEACVQQPGTVRGADGSRLKQKPVSLRFSGITSLRTRFCGSKRARRYVPPLIRNRNLPGQVQPPIKTRSTVGVISLKLARSSSCRGFRIRLFIHHLLLSVEHRLLLFITWCMGWYSLGVAVKSWLCWVFAWIVVLCSLSVCCCVWLFGRTVCCFLDCSSFNFVICCLLDCLRFACVV